MTWVLFLYALAGLSYLILMLFLISGWKRTPAFVAPTRSPSTKISVIIAARNEEKNIPNLLSDLSKQNYPKELLEVIIADDCSEDHTVKLIQDFSQKNNLLLHIIEMKKIIVDDSANNSSKKRALTEAINQSTAELIITTDADCRMGSNWLSTLAHFYEKEKPDFISAPVVFSSEKTMFQKLQSLEFLGLIGSGASFIGLRKPIMCNGANIAFTKNMFTRAGGYSSHHNIASGDDVLLMHEIKAHHGKIRFLKSKEAIVYTEAENNFSSFFNQRKRWASKNLRVSTPATTAIAAIIFLTNLLIIAGLIISLFSQQFLIPSLFLFAAKSILDFIFLKEIAAFTSKKNLLYLILPAQLFVSLYSILVILSSPFGNYSWKGRKINSIN